MTDPERASPEAAEPAYLAAAAPTATVSSLKSDHSTEHLICTTPDDTKPKRVKELSVTSKSAEAGSERAVRGRRLVVLLGLAQVVLGALLVGAGALGVVKGAALARVGAGLWAGCVAVVAGVVGVLAGINDCYGLYGAGSGSPLLTAFLALSLLCLACGNSAAVLAATGLQRDSQRANPTEHTTFEDEMQAWTPVLTNIALLIIAAVHCVVCVVSIYCVSRRVCPCFRQKQAFDHNQFEPGKGPVVVHLDENNKPTAVERPRGHELARDLEGRLHGDTVKKKKEESTFDSANSKERLVSSWLGRQPAGAGGRRRPPRAARPPRGHPAPIMLLPAHPASTLGRVPTAFMVPPAPAPRYATLPLPPPHMYYPIHDTRMRRRRSPRSAGGVERRRREAREKDSQLARSLERIHRKRRARADHLSDAELKRTYTGLDRTYAEQFIQVIDESRLAAEQHDSLASTATSDTRPSAHS